MQDGLTLEEAAEILGYSNPESLKRRIRVLRKEGRVLDAGRPPAKYPTVTQVSHPPKSFQASVADHLPALKGPAVILHWLHPKYFLIDRKMDRSAFPITQEFANEQTRR